MDTAQPQSLVSLLDELMHPPRIPRATYRLQFNTEFTFDDARELVPYLHKLGISDLYTSPLFKPRSTSTHGYDTVDYNQFNPKLGDEDEFNQLAEVLSAHQMGLMLDLVPNHMGVSTENVWWTDVLKEGLSSKYAHFFDIAWRSQNRSLDDKVLLPVLGDHYGRILEAGELKLVYWHGDFYLHYYEHQFPITPETYGVILEKALENLDELSEEDEWVALELASIIHSLKYLPPFYSTGPTTIETRRREETIVRWRLLGLFDKAEVFRNALQAALSLLNGDPDDPSSFDTLDDLLSRQAFRLAYWRVATDEINYRRFFDINDMAAIRVEDEAVFQEVHRLTFRLLAEGKVNGLRIDHPDGLWDPETYFWRLQAGCLEAIARQQLPDIDAETIKAAVSKHMHAFSQSQPQRKEWPLYVVAEKILSETEPMPYSWAVHGTTGYDFMYAMNNLFVNTANEEVFDRIYGNFIGEAADFDAIVDRTKHLVMSQSLTSELDSRSAELAAIVEQNRRYRGFTQNGIAFALSEVIKALHVYRTYVTIPETVTNRDRMYVEEAIFWAKKHNPLVPTSVFDFLKDTLLMRNWEDFEERHHAALRDFVMKFQQITGPVMAKSVEDTAFYVYNRLTSLNEVGGHPVTFGLRVEHFHHHNLHKSYPHTMLATSTHDTKRSEDVRARINVLSDMPDEWETMLLKWAETNEHAKTVTHNNESTPSENDEYLIYQTLLGAYDPEHDENEDFKRRIIAYMHKAINEAKTHSNWINPNDEYAEAIANFISTIWDDEHFQSSFLPFQKRVAFYGRVHSLAQVLLKLSAPGVPDIYQGNELWDYSLVDPDNRRLIDFERRQEYLDTLIEREAEDRPSLIADLVEDTVPGMVKLYLIYRLLNFRREHEALFRDGAYLPLQVEGEQSSHVCAFARQGEDQLLVVVVPRLIVSLADGAEILPTGEGIWGDTVIVLPADFSGEHLENLITGETVPVDTEVSLHTVPMSRVLQQFPVAALRLPTQP